MAFAPPVSINTPDTGTNCALVDVDGDGKLDIVASGRVSNAMHVFRNTGNAAINVNTFAAAVTFAAGTGPGSVLPADLDNDGKPDFILPSRRLAVFIDGPHHETDTQRAADAAIDRALDEQGFLVVRFPKEQARWPDIFKNNADLFGPGKT